MKNVKLFLSAFAIFAIVGSALAFKFGQGTLYSFSGSGCVLSGCDTQNHSLGTCTGTFYATLADCQADINRINGAFVAPN